MRDLGRISLTVSQPSAVRTNAGTPPVVGKDAQEQQSFADRIAVTIARVLNVGRQQERTLRYSPFVQQKSAQKIAEKQGTRLESLQSQLDAYGSIRDFLRRPSVSGGAELLKSEGAKGMLSHPSVAKYAPTITKAIGSIAKLTLAIGAMVAAVAATAAIFVFMRRTLMAFAEKVQDYSAAVTAAQTQAEYTRQVALIRAGMGASGYAASRAVGQQGKFDAAIIRLQAALAPILNSVVTPVMKVLTKIVNFVASIAEMLTNLLIGLSGTLAELYSTLAPVVKLFNPIGGMIMEEMGEEFAHMNKTLKDIKKNTDPDADIDYAAANAPFIADLALMGVTNYASARLP
jgi:hypothetical protein